MKKLLRYALLYCVLLSVPHLVFTQTAGAFSLDLGFLGQSDELADGGRHVERNYVLGLGYGLSDRWSLLVQGTLIRSNLSNLDGDRGTAHLVTLSTQLDLLPKNRHRLYVEAGMGTGNYCTCGNEGLPRIESNLLYAHYGLGVDFQLKRHVYLELAFRGNPIMTRTPESYDYNIGTIGLRFDDLFSFTR